jgi:hypothetical protein
MFVICLLSPDMVSVAVCLVPPDMVSIDLSGHYPPRQGQRIYFGRCYIHRVDSVTPNNRVIMRIMTGRGGLQLNMCAGPQFCFW